MSIAKPRCETQQYWERRCQRDGAHTPGKARRRKNNFPIGEARKRGIVMAAKYTYLPDLLTEVELPKSGILSRVLHKDDRLNVTLFAFSAGHELSTHSAPTPAVMYFLQGEADVQLGDDTVPVHAGSFIHMTPMLPHAVSPKTDVVMLLVQVKLEAREARA
jgi:quercetin dioxygenase-like cupin family protein